MDVDQRSGREIVGERARSQVPAPGRPSNRWLLPTMVALAVVVGALSVPVLMWLAPRLGSSSTAALEVAPSASSEEPSAAPASAGASPVTEPTVLPTMPLASAPPPAPPRATTAPTATAPAVGARRASVEPARGVGGQLVTVSGVCEPGTDAQVAVSTAAKQAVNQDGSFSVRVQVGASARVGQTVQVPVTCTPAAGGKGVTFSAPFVVSAVVSVPASLPGDTGQVEVQQNGKQAQLSAGGFQAGTPVLFEVRLDNGVVESQRRVVVDDAGAVDVLGVTLGSGTQRLVLSGIGQDGGRRVLVATVSTPSDPAPSSSGASSPSAAEASPSA